MARGITSFRNYGKRDTPLGPLYCCLYCMFQVQRRRGNALAGHSKAVATIKAHVEQHHKDKL